MSRSQDLGTHFADAKILAAYCPNSRHVRLLSGTPETVEREALATALGHFYLHRRVADGGLHHPTLGFAVVEYKPLPESVGFNGRQYALCRQAGQFGAALLVSREQLTTAVVEAQSRIGITRRPGRIHIDEQPQNVADAKQIAAAVARTLGVTQRTVIDRARQLGIIEEEGHRILTGAVRASGFTRVSDILWEVLIRVEQGSRRAA